jgi:uncharacterized membrane protein YcaP (DUF421 family)
VSESSYHFLDPLRVLLGSTPATFVVEVVLRLIVLYATLVIAMRLRGRRMSSQLTRNELLGLVTLAGAAGPAVQDPTRGLLPAIVSAATVVLVQRGYVRLTVRSERIERFFDGDPARLVCDGRLELDVIRHNGISRQRLFAELRAAGILQLGAVERVYLEPSGTFCVLPRHTPREGLSLVPEWDPELLAEQTPAEGVSACFECGALTREQAPPPHCPHCAAAAKWVRAMRP